MKRILSYLAAFSLLLICTTSCEEAELQGYEGGSSVNFTISNKTHSFYGMTESDHAKDTVEISLMINGHTSDVDRVVAAKAVAGENTTADPADYNILGGVIPAGKIEGTLYVELLNRDASMIGDGKSTASLQIQIAENQDFSMGLLENRNVTLTWSRALVKPDNWDSLLRTYFTRYYSTAAYKLIIMLYGSPNINFAKSSTVGGFSAEGFAWARIFYEYVTKWNAEHPDDPLVHDDGEAAGQRITPSMTF